MTEGLSESLDLKARVLDRLGRRPFVDLLGAELVSAEPGRLVMRLPWRAQHTHSGVLPGNEPSLHGGAAASLADIAASSALSTVLAEGEGRTTIALAIHYLAPLRGDVIAEARVRRRGGRTAFIDIDLTGGDGTLGAVARATFAILPARNRVP